MTRLLMMVLFAALSAVRAGAEPAPRKALVVWLIPSEPATPAAGIGGLNDCESDARPAGTLPGRIEEEIDAYNTARSQTRVTVINTQDPFKMQLIDWSPEMAVPNWVWVKSQTETLRALERFADQNRVDIRVRFITWDRALADLKSTWEGRSAYEPPDVVQIGSTWTGYFQSHNLLLTKPRWDVNRNGWEDVESTRACALPYVNDARLIFFWRRLPGARPDSEAFGLDSGSWPAVLGSLKAPTGGGPPFAMPIGLTLNLLHDYASLVWSGGGDFLADKWFLGHRLDLVGSRAVAAVDYLAEQSVVMENGRPRRLIAFPEASHEEVTRSFVQGLYRATMEPANFISRWKRDFTCRNPSQAGAFWKYAGAAVPPTPFRGGSYLAVWSRTSFVSHAFALSEFLTEDEVYTRMLGVVGYLPARRPGGGVDLLPASSDADRGAAEFAAAVQQALSPKVGRVYPPIREFSSVLESREMLERLQIAWRRVSERDPEALHAQLRQVEQYVNREIYLPARVWGAVSEVAGIVSFAATVVLALLVFLNRGRMVALRHVAQVRGFSAAGTLLIETVHGVFHNPAAIEGIGPGAARKGAMIMAALQGWRRGRDPRNWDATQVGDVIWRSIILALDSTVSLGVFRDWRQSRRPAREYLQEWVDDPSRSRAGALLSFVVTYPPSRMQPMPFMLEQALVCLLQNSIKTLLHPDFDAGDLRRISIEVQNDSIVIFNPGPPLGRPLCDAINLSRTPEEFEERISALLRTDAETRPGFGLVEAYCILSQCFGGLRVSYDVPRFEAGLSAPTIWRRLFRARRPERTASFVIAARPQAGEANC
jgi:hypothetical protein